MSNSAKNTDSARTDGKDELVLTDPLAESSLVHTVPVHVPGLPLATRSDIGSTRAYEAEKADHAATAVPEVLPSLDTRSPRANLLTRSNIVPAGPGSAGDEPALPLPGLPAEDQLVEPSRNGVQVIELRDAE